VGVVIAVIVVINLQNRRDLTIGTWSGEFDRFDLCPGGTIVCLTLLGPVIERSRVELLLVINIVWTGGRERQPGLLSLVD
jgi:hypothetical protein